MSMPPVLLVSFLLHALIGWRIAPALAGTPLQALLWGWLALSGLLIPLSFVVHRLLKPPLSTVVTWLGLISMGLFSSLLVLTLLRELLLLGVQIIDWLQPGTLILASWRAESALAVLALAGAATLWGFWNARRVAGVVRVDVPIANLPEALQGFTVAQISDLHVGSTIRRNYVQRIVARVNALGADLVAITGDLVDGSVHELADHVAPLAGLLSTHGTFFVTGNHEYYSGADGWVVALKGLGIQVLMNEHVVIQHHTDSQDPEQALMVVAGVTDFGAHHFDKTQRSDPHQAIANAPDNSVFKLLLAHQPRSAAAAAQAGFDLQLSGHTHGGQFWPWNHFVRLQQPFTAGLHKLQALWVYTSRGTGYWGPPKRFGAPSEITHLRLVRAA